MNAQPAPPPTPAAPASPRFDRQFIEDHQLLERYLENKLPVKGARELELWCRANPAYLEEQAFSERTQASLKLLEAGGRPLDLGDPKPPWWHTPYLSIGLGVAVCLSLIAFWALFGKYHLLRSELTDARTAVARGPLVQPATESNVYVTPDHAAGIDHAKVSVSRSSPQLMDVHIDMSFTKLTQFRLFVDKQDQGRALVLNNLVKDSNNELRFTLNSSGLSAGSYAVRIEGLPFKGSPVALGWLRLEVH